MKDAVNFTVALFGIILFIIVGFLKLWWVVCGWIARKGVNVGFKKK